MKLFGIFSKIGTVVDKTEEFIKLGAAFIRGAKALQTADLDHNGKADVKDIENDTNVLEKFIVDRVKFHATAVATDIKFAYGLGVGIMKRVNALAEFVKTQSAGEAK